MEKSCMLEKNEKIWWHIQVPLIMFYIIIENEWSCDLSYEVKSTFQSCQEEAKEQQHDILVLKMISRFLMSFLDFSAVKHNEWNHQINMFII